MIIHPLVGKAGGGRLGNSLFEIATLIGLSKKYGCNYAIPQWKYSEYLEYEIPKLEILPEPDATIQEISFKHTPEYWDMFQNDFRTKNVYVKGWLQSEKNWSNAVGEVKQAFTFKKDFSESVKDKFSHIFNKPIIAISVRRGDFVDNPNHYLLSVQYYITALFTYFSDYQNYNIVFFSDDLSYCKTHFECLDNVYFSDGLTDIEQLCLMTFATHYIIANSTFSWWGAYLGEKTNSLVIRPEKHFRGKLKEETDISDHYPTRWITHKEQGKFDLKDVTFFIPVHYDHNDRKENIELSICILQRLFDTNIIVGEQGGNFFDYLPNVTYINFAAMQYFHRTKMGNQMVNIAKTEILVNFDCDVIIPPLQLLLSILKIRNGEADIVYPYDGRFARVHRNFFDKVRHFLDIGCLGGIVFNGMRNGDAESVGGCVVYSKSAYISAGGENERYISYAPEDAERFYRFFKLGYTIRRIKGVLYHLDHFIGLNSSTEHQHFAQNTNIFEEEKKLSNEEYKQYCKQFTWLKK